MYPCGDLLMPGAIPTRRYRIGATVVEGQVAVWDGINGPGEISDPASVNSYADGVGITMEAGTYATSTPHVFVKCSYSPTQLVRAKASGGATADTAHTTATLLTQDTASTTVLTDAEVATLDYSCGLLVGLSGNNKGSARILSSQSDNTSCTVSVAFANSIAVGDTVIRTYSPNISGVELTTDFCQVNNLIAAGEALFTDDLGEFITVEILIDGSSLMGTNYVPILNPTNPILEFVMIFGNHVLNPID